MNNDICRIADHYGYEPQSRQLIEEMAELTVAINKLWRKSGNGQAVYNCHDCLNSIYEEIADVEIMLEQIKHLLNCHDEVEAFIEFKIRRTLERMESENG